MSYERKKLEHEILHAEKSGLIAIECLKRISRTLSDDCLHGYCEELDQISIKISEQAGLLANRISSQFKNRGGYGKNNSRG